VVRRSLRTAAALAVGSSVQDTRTRRWLGGSAGLSASGEHGPRLPHPRSSVFDHAERGGVATFMIHAVSVEEVDVGEGAVAGRAVRPLDAVPTVGAAGAGHRQPSRLVLGHHRSVGPPADRKSKIGRDEPDGTRRSSRRRVGRRAARPAAGARVAGSPLRSGRAWSLLRRARRVAVRERVDGGARGLRRSSTWPISRVRAFLASASSRGPAGSVS
jgi:hypothetical protein